MELKKTQEALAEKQQTMAAPIKEESSSSETELELEKDVVVMEIYERDLEVRKSLEAQVLIALNMREEIRDAEKYQDLKDLTFEELIKEQNCKDMFNEGTYGQSYLKNLHRETGTIFWPLKNNKFSQLEYLQR